MSMNCPKCGKRAKIIDTRDRGEGIATTVRRRYKCIRCVKRWSTVEQIVHAGRKRTGTHSLLDRLNLKALTQAQAELRAELGSVLGFKEAA